MKAPIPASTAAAPKGMLHNFSATYENILRTEQNWYMVALKAHSPGESRHTGGFDEPGGVATRGTG